MFSGALADGTTRPICCGATGWCWRWRWWAAPSLPRRLWEKREQALSPALSDGLRTVWTVIVLLVSIAFLVGDSYNPFLYFRF